MRGLFICVLFLIGLGKVGAGELLEWKPLPDLPSELGVAGPFTGLHEGTLLVAGGANFPRPIWESDKVWHDTIYGLALSGKSEWRILGRLPRPIGYGACVSAPDGVICLGGNDAGEVFDSAYYLTAKGETFPLPLLPEANCYGAATRLGNHVYLAGGTSGLGMETVSGNFLRLDLTDLESGWVKLESWPGEKRAFATLVTQSNGDTDCIYLLGGRYEQDGGALKFLRDVFVYNPKTERWSRCASLPTPFAAGTAVPLGQNHLAKISGADGSLFEQADMLKENHPGFPKPIYVYHTITDTWTVAGEMPMNQVTTHAVAGEGRLFLASGEVKPRERTKAVWEIALRDRKPKFAGVNWVAIGGYLFAVMGIGFFFARRNKNTEDFFRGGQRIPGWVAGLSIFATLLSSITFVATPARAFATDWTFLLINAGILICAPFIAYLVLPFFRKMNATSAYEYLEDRFNLPIRLFASASFVFFQIGRMAIVMYLPALALAAITPLSLSWCIVIMGLLSIVYCSLGGLEAVVWTDALQAIVLIGGAVVSFLWILFGLEGGWSEYTAVAVGDGKLRWADFDWGANSYMTATFWVVLVSGIGQALIPYSSDQAVVQRYVSTPTEAKARSAIWLNAGMSMVGTFLFFGLGTALYVFYKARPESLDPGFKTDSIFPMFIARELPVGVAGLVIAAIFAAAQSTISTSMNSTSTAIVTDFFRRLGWKASEKAYLRLARVVTVLLGAIGTGSALILAKGNTQSAWEVFMTVIGFVMGPLCGIFLLGMFTKRGNATGAVCGAAGGVALLVFAKYGTEISGLLYAPIGIAGAFGIGWIASEFSKRPLTVPGD